MLLVQEFLKTHTFRQLAEQFGVYASFAKSGYKFSLNYDQIESKESDVLAQQCRGLVLSTVDGHSLSSQAIEIDGRLRYDDICPGETAILAYPMDRFFNNGQGAAAKIDWNDPNISILEKLDGTLTIVYFDKFSKQWCVATRSVPEADLIIDMGVYTFRTLFEKAVKDTLNLDFDMFTTSLVKDMTYCFELTTPYNRIVVKYDDFKITLLSVRYIPTLKELDPTPLAIVLIGKVPCVHAYTYMSIDDILKWVSDQNPLEHEGVVVRDSNYNRIKIKNAAYVAFNRTRDILSASDRNILDLIFQEKDDDVLPMLSPEIANKLQKMKKDTQDIIKLYDEIYFKVGDMADSIMPGDKKTFALTVNSFVNEYKLNNQKLWTAPLFQIFSGKAKNMKDFIQKNRNKDGHWSNGFLDIFLELSNTLS